MVLNTGTQLPCALTSNGIHTYDRNWSQPVTVHSCFPMKGQSGSEVHHGHRSPREEVS